MPSDYNDWRLRQMEEEQNHNEQIVPEEWDEFCEEVVIANTGRRPYEDQSWIYGRKDR
ncbi:hypothetical protein ACWIYZ_04790 [Ursidibacter arcticus]